MCPAEFSSEQQLFDEFKQSIRWIDPVAWAEDNLYLDGRPFRLNGNGYKPFVDIYRYIGVKSVEKNSKPVVIVKGRQVGGTIMSCVLSLYFTSSGRFGSFGKPPMRIMHCFPQNEQAENYAKDKLTTMISSSRPLIISAGKAKGQPKSYIETRLDKTLDQNSNKFKKFLGNNILHVQFAGLTGDRLRSYTVDGIFFDETQDTKSAAIASISELMKQSQWGKEGSGIQIFFGTPKKKGSDFHKLWEKSSKQYFHLGCEKCKDYFPFYTPGSDEWETIWVEDFTVQCVFCGHMQNKVEAIERGKWIAENPDADYVGFHINQLYMPRLSKKIVTDQKPEKNPFKTERTYQNEVLGEFYSGVTTSLSMDDLDTRCSDKARGMIYQIAYSPIRKVYAGFDWGQKMDPDQLEAGEEQEAKAAGGTSYSCGVILVPEGTLLSVQFATKFKKNDLEYKEALVEELMRNFSVNLAVGDIGNANDLLPRLHQRYGSRFIASQALDQVRDHIKYDRDIMPPCIKFDRNFYAEELIELLKAGRIKFPYDDHRPNGNIEAKSSYDRVYWLLEHCTNVEPIAVRDKYGDVKVRYVRGGGPIDGFMALLNAYLAYKFDLTGGFDEKHHSLVQVGDVKENKPKAVLAWAPRNTGGSRELNPYAGTRGKLVSGG